MINIKNIIPRDFYVSKWIVLLIDLFTILFTFVLSYLIRFNFTLDFDHESFKYQLPLILVIAIISFLITGSYKGIIRHTGIQDAYNVFYASVLFTFILTILVILNRQFDLVDIIYPRSILAIHFLLNVIFLIGSRFVFKQIYHGLVNTGQRRKKALIYGAGAAGRITFMALSNDSNDAYEVKGFIDDNKDLKGKRLKGLPVIYAKKLDKKLIESWKIDEIIISVQNIGNVKLFKIIDKLLSLDVVVKNTPPVSHWIDGKLKSYQIKEIKVEDILQRKPIDIFNKEIAKQLHDKTVLVTGAAGSIGSEICRQLTQYSCKELIFIDQAESPLYELQMNLKSVKNNHVTYYLANVSNRARMEEIFSNHDVDCVFHAAAYKHVPLMEENPVEAMRVNVLGSKTIMDLAVEHKVEKFVMVSTDKAVNPTNVMGASKRTAELYAQIKNDENVTKFVTTRFGNVLGSNGSVIPLFKKQIENGGPVTVTHPEIIRYFMTISEACQLVLEAGIMGEGGEIFVFDMGESVKIIDVAKNMIRLAGYSYPDEIDIKIVGLRPGEKLFEELLHDSERTIPTHHHKIMKARKDAFDKKTVSSFFNEIQEILTKNQWEQVKKLKEIIPEFKSNNSTFEVLDKD
jgi:FlaA1/EpsC-like NDP-sugar epimerase